MNETSIANLNPPRFENGKLLLIAGTSERYDRETSAAGIAAQWQRFARYQGKVPGQIGEAAYGVCYNTDAAGNLDYLCGVEVSDFSALPEGFSCMRLPEQKYVVFFHAGHISAIRSTWDAIWNKWLPQSGHELVDAPFFELYGPSFNGQTGTGGVELWIPIK